MMDPKTAPTPADGLIIGMRDVGKHYAMGEGTITALTGVNLDVERGAFMAIMGPSGSGKSTLMNIIGLLDHSDEGSYLLEGIEVASLSDDQRSRLRNRTIGFVFQNFNLLPQASALRNVMLPLTYRPIPDAQRVMQAETALNRVGMSPRQLHRPWQLSGGERQRVAIARALVGEPAVILADEPTGNLDSHTGLDIIAILRELAQSGKCVIMVTHDTTLAKYADRIIRMLDGRIVVA